MHRNSKDPDQLTFKAFSGSVNDQRRPRLNKYAGIPNTKPLDIQSNLNSSNTDGSFTMANSNSFLSPYKFLQIAPDNKYLEKISYFIMTLYAVYTH